MTEVSILHALAEYVGNSLVAQDIESVGGAISPEQLSQLQSLVLKDVMKLRFEDAWPPQHIANNKE